MAKKTSKQSAIAPEPVLEKAELPAAAALIEDTLPSMSLDVVELVEAVGKPKKYIARGEFGKCDEPTKNKRVYRKELWEREIKKLQKALENRNVYGHLDHPDSGKTLLSLASHIVTHLEIKDGLIIGEAEILNTTHGQNLKALLDAKCKVGVSSRGYGTVKKNAQGHDVVQDDYRLVSWDFVCDPSDGDAYPEIFLESKQLVLQGADIPLVEEEPPVADEKKDEAPAELDTAGVDAVAAANKEPITAQGIAEVPGVSGTVGPKTTETESVAAEEVQYQIHKAIEETRKETQFRLREEFSRSLVAAVNEAKVSFRDEMRKELEQDPSVTGAKLALERVRGILLPLVLPEETKNHIKKLEEDFTNKIDFLQNSLLERELTIKNMEERVETLGKMAKEAAYKFYVESVCATDPDQTDLRKRIGDVNDYKSAADLKVKVESLKEEFSSRRAAVAAEAEKTRLAEEKARVAHEELERMHRADTELKIEEAKQNAIRVVEEEYGDQLEKMKLALDKALEANTLLQVRVQAEAKLTNNPKAPKIRAVLESTGVKSESEANNIIESFREPVRNVDELAELRAKINKRINGGTSSRLEEEASPRGSRHRALSQEIGVDVASALVMAGVKR